jgi:hypothetical protein
MKDSTEYKGQNKRQTQVCSGGDQADFMSSGQGKPLSLRSDDGGYLIKPLCHRLKAKGETFV